MDSIVTEKIRENSLLEEKDDKFNYFMLAQNLLDYIESKQFPIAVGVYGRIGSGKSVLINFIKKSTSRERIKFIDFNVIEFIGSNIDLESSLKKIIDRNQSFFFYICMLIPYSFLVILGGISLLFSYLTKDRLTWFWDLGLYIVDYSKKLYFYLSRLFNKHIIIIDNLDRIDPKLAIEFLEKLHALFFSNSKLFSSKFAYLVACDFLILKNEIIQIYGELINVRDYLNKIIEAPFYLPTYNVNLSSDFIKSLLNEGLPEKIQKQIISTIHTSNINTPSTASKK